MMLLKLHQMGIETYKKKVDCLTQLRKAIVNAKAKLVATCSAICDILIHVRQVQLDKKACVEN
jgi:hypothetical protein